MEEMQQPQQFVQQQQWLFVSSGDGGVTAYQGHYTDARMSFEMKSPYFQSYEKGTTSDLLKKQGHL